MAYSEVGMDCAASAAGPARVRTSKESGRMEVRAVVNECHPERARDLAGQR
jgi:hypothetical protein